MTNRTAAVAIPPRFTGSGESVPPAAAAGGMTFVAYGVHVASAALLVHIENDGEVMRVLTNRAVGFIPHSSEALLRLTHPRL